MRNLFFRLPDREQRIGSWLAVAVCALCIFLTIPVARRIQGFFEAWLGHRAYLVAAAIGGVFLALVVCSYIFRRRKRRIALRLAWLSVSLAGAVWVMRNQLQTPAEAIHFFEYGVLSFLLFRAWSHDVRDWLIYPASAMSLLVIAAADECLQWLVPGRYWDLRDIRLNAMAGLFVQAIIALVIHPSAIESGVKPRSVRILCRICWVALAVAGAVLSNTPARVELYSSKIPFLRFLLDHGDSHVMTEYGHRHTDPDIGVFYSRLTIPEMLRNDDERGVPVGEMMARLQDSLDYPGFLRMFNTRVDPLMHEMRVHLHRRDHYLETAPQYLQKDPARYTYHMTVAFRENQILETYFPKVLAASGSAWDNGVMDEVRLNADMAEPYVSPVSDHLVTRATESELWFLLILAAGLVFLIYRRYGREPALALKSGHGG